MTLLADRLRSDKRWRRLGTDSDDEATIKEWVTSRIPPVYDISNVADFLAEGNADFVALEHFPNVAPLHILYWMEWKSPARVLPLLALKHGNEPARVGVLIWQEGPPVDGEWPVGIHAWGMWNRYKRAEPLVSWRVTMREQECPVVESTHIYPDINRLFEHYNRTPKAGTVELPFVESEEHARRLIAEHKELLRQAEARMKDAERKLDECWGTWVRLAVLHPALMAHSLLSCKNVVTDDHRPARARSKRHERQTGKPLVSFKTLRIRPMGGSSSAGSAGDGLDRPLHIVRGHFKTFTEERPLFGRVTGTYWWSAQLRGNAERGVVIKEYEVMRANDR